MTIGAIRDLAWSAAGILLLAIFSAYISANVRQLAAKLGWDNHLLRLWGSVETVSRWKLREKWWLWLFLGLTSGLAVALTLLSAPQAPPQNGAVQSGIQTARLRLHYTQNPITSDVIQKDNVATLYTFAFLADGTSVTESSDPIKWTNLIIVFDRPLTVTNIRVTFDSGGSLIYSITKIDPRLAIIHFEGSLANKVVDIEVH